MTDISDEDGRQVTDRRSPGIPEIASHFAKLVVVGMIVQLAVIGYVFATEYSGRKVAMTAAQLGCEQDILDRKASIIMNENVLISFEESQKKTPKFKTERRKDALAKIAVELDGLRDRARINCKDRYPNPRAFP